MGPLKLKIIRLAIICFISLSLSLGYYAASRSPQDSLGATSNTSSTREECVCAQYPVSPVMNAFTSICGGLNAALPTVPPTIEIANHDAPASIRPDIVGPTVTLTVTAKPVSDVDFDVKPWKYDPVRDSSTYSLSADRCSIAFPQFSREIERAAKYQAKIGKVKEEDMNRAWKIASETDTYVKAMTVDRQLFILEAKINFKVRSELRALPLLHSLHRALVSSQEEIPNIIFSFTTNDLAEPDGSGRAIWALTRKVNEKMKWVMPDFGSWSWTDPTLGPYESIRREINDTELPFPQKKKQVVWRGQLQSNPMRERLLRVTRKKSWADVEQTYYDNGDLGAPSWSSTLTIPEQCNYQFLVQTEGYSYSSRGIYLVNCNSVYIAADPIWLEPHTHLFIEAGINQNFVRVKRDFSDLEAKIKDLLADPTRAEDIARRGAAMFRDKYVTPAVQACYWRHMLTEWAKVSEAPNIWENESVNGGRSKGRGRKIRGVPFEDWAIQLAEINRHCGWIAWWNNRC